METPTYIRETEYTSLRGFMREMDDAGSETAALVARAVREELTERQMQMAELYFVRQLTMREIAQMLGVNPSTVSRSLQSARRKLRKCLRYGARALLKQDMD